MSDIVYHCAIGNSNALALHLNTTFESSESGLTLCIMDDNISFMVLLPWADVLTMSGGQKPHGYYLSVIQWSRNENTVDFTTYCDSLVQKANWSKNDFCMYLIIIIHYEIISNILLDEKGPYIVLYFNTKDQVKRCTLPLILQLMQRHRVEGNVLLNSLERDVASVHLDMTKDKLIKIMASLKLLQVILYKLTQDSSETKNV